LNEEYIQQEFSWTVISAQKVLKQVDKSVFLYRTSGIPVEIRWFFNIEDLPPGEKQEVILVNERESYKAFFSMSLQDSPRSRLIWKSDFARLIQGKFPSQ
jgi:5-methylcytosine-specific restriction protein A